MKKFIKVTRRADDQPTYINVAHIVQITNLEDSTRLVLSTETMGATGQNLGSILWIKEPAEAILDALTAFDWQIVDVAAQVNG